LIDRYIDLLIYVRRYFGNRSYCYDRIHQYNK